MDITQTAPAFGSVEAYAKRRRRSVDLCGTGILLSLQQSVAGESSSSLGRLAEGTPFTLQLLSEVVSSLRGLKFVAHLDDEDVMNVPALEVALRSVQFLYSFIRANVASPFAMPRRANLPDDLAAYYADCRAEARAAYA
jgi:hypothetical protein